MFIIEILFSGCSALHDPVLDSLGKYQSKAFYTSGGFQDYTDYAKYTYENVNFAENEYFTKIDTADIETIESYVDNFEEWVAILLENNQESELKNYDFSRTKISTENYFYLYVDKEYPAFGNYDLYIYATDEKILYFFHNNI